MRVVPVLLVLSLSACAHVQPAKKASDRCADVTSPRDVLRARNENRELFLKAVGEIDALAGDAERKRAELNVRNRGPKPLSDDETLRADRRLEGVQIGLTNESAHLRAVAGQAFDLQALSDNLVAEPRLTELRDLCRADRRKAEAELSQTNFIVSEELGELSAAAREYGLAPVAVVRVGS
jgi:hypothetical protein